MPASKKFLTEEGKREFHYVSTHTRRIYGRFIVRLPVHDSVLNLSFSYNIAVNRLHSMERLFVRDNALREQYNDFLQECETLMSHVKPRESNATRIAYLPHYGVWKNSGVSSKIRVVFKSSATLECGATLNQQFIIGPNLLPPLVNILLR